MVAADGVMLDTVLDDGSMGAVAKYGLASDGVFLMPPAPAPVQLFAAAFRWQIPDPAAEKALGRAIEMSQRASRRVQLRVAEVAYAMDRPELADPLAVPTSTRTWFEAQSLARKGELDEASRLLVQLPPGVFPARLGVWAMAAESMSVPVGEQVHSALDRMAGAGEILDAAVEVVRFALAAAAGDAGEVAAEARRQVEVAAPELAGEYLTRAKQAGQTPAGRLLRTIEDRPSSLREDPELLTQAPRALIDELIEGDVIDTHWLEFEWPDDTGEYLAARLDPTRVDDAALQRLGLSDEQARRAVVRGQSLPSGLPEPVAERYRGFARLLGGDTDMSTAVELLDEDDASLAHELERSLARAGGVPDDRLLRSPLARQILGRRALDTIELGELTRPRLSAEQARFVGTVAIGRSRRALYGWDYDQAIGHAKDCLRLCDDEPIRDEALNLIAAASWALGSDEAAIRALETALDGEYTFALQANIGLVAQELEPDVAGEHLANLITHAPDLRLRVAAAKRTLAIWGSKELPGDQENDLPADVATAVRDLMNEPIGPDDFRLFARLLADHDSAWMATFDTQSSPHARSDAARLYAARARGIDEFIAALATFLQGEQAPDWMRTERDQLVDAVIDALLADEPMVGAVSLGELMLEQRLPMGQAEQIVMRGLMARMVALAVVGDEGGEPAIRFLDALEQDAAQLDSLDDADRDRASKAVEFGFEAVTRAYLVYRWEQLGAAAEYHDEVVGQTAYTPRWRRNHGAVQQAATQIEHVAADTRQLFERLRRNVTGELADALDDAIGTCNRLVDAARALPRM